MLWNQRRLDPNLRAMGKFHIWTYMVGGSQNVRAAKVLYVIIINNVCIQWINQKLICVILCTHINQNTSMLVLVPIPLCIYNFFNSKKSQLRSDSTSEALQAVSPVHNVDVMVIYGVNIKQFQIWTLALQWEYSLQCHRKCLLTNKNIA